MTTVCPQKNKKASHFLAWRRQIATEHCDYGITVSETLVNVATIPIRSKTFRRQRKQSNSENHKCRNLLHINLTHWTMNPSQNVLRMLADFVWGSTLVGTDSSSLQVKYRPTSFDVVWDSRSTLTMSLSWWQHHKLYNYYCDYSSFICVSLASGYAIVHILSWSRSLEIEGGCRKGIRPKNTFGCMTGFTLAPFCVAAAGQLVREKHEWEATSD